MKTVVLGSMFIYDSSLHTNILYQWKAGVEMEKQEGKKFNLLVSSMATQVGTYEFNSATKR